MKGLYAWGIGSDGGVELGVELSDIRESGIGDEGSARPKASHWPRVNCPDNIAARKGQVQGWRRRQEEVDDARDAVAIAGSIALPLRVFCLLLLAHCRSETCRECRGRPGIAFSMGYQVLRTM